MRSSIVSHTLRLVLSVCAGMSLLAGSACVASAASAWPARPVRIIVPFPAGGDLDTVARLLAQGLSARTGGSFIVENRAGAGGTVGAGYVAHSAPDGYTLLLGSSGDQVNAPYLYRKLPFSVEHDLAPISILARGYLVLIANPAAPYSDVRGLVAYARANPGKVDYATSGIGTASHLAGELLQQVAGVKLLHVPYNGNAPGLTALIGNQVGLLFASPVTAEPYIQRHLVKPIAATTPYRKDVNDATPTFVDAGLPIDVATLYVLTAPAGLPAAVRDLLSRDVMAVVASPEMTSRLRALSVIPVGDTPAQAQALLTSERQRWKAVIQKAGVTVE